MRKKLVLVVLLLVAGLALAACDDTDGTQGVTDTKIYVGNTAAVSGALATVGLPFNSAIEAVFERVNAAGGIDGRTIEFISYDDEFNAEKGLTFTEQLIEEDEVFALVGHFGTPTVGATLDMIQSVGIPMVYAATGINDLYFEQSPGNPVMAVQPIYLTDGRLMAARAIKEAVYGENGDAALAADAKVGVLYTNDDVGTSIKEGIEIEAGVLDKADDFIYETVTELTVSTAVEALKTAGVETVILAMNQVPFSYSVTALADGGLNVPVFSSYVNADVSAVAPSSLTDIYVNAWVDLTSESGAADVADFVDAISSSSLSDEQKNSYYTNSFATAGYIAAMIFVEGLERVAANGDELTWENYIAAMEESEIDVPLGGTVDFSGGKRWGIDSMSLLKYTYSYGDDPSTTDVVEDDFLLESFVKVAEIETLTEIESK